MNRTTVHRVDGVGKQVAPDSDKPFNPRVFEQAIHGLQKNTIDFARYTNEYAEEYTANHTPDTDDDGEKVIHIEDDTVLDDVCYTLLPKWDKSVLIDTQFDNSYAVRASVDCGGEIVVYITVYVQDGILSKFEVGHTDLTTLVLTTHPQPADARVGDLTIHTSSRELTHLNRFLERNVMAAYAITIDSAATAFDYIATRADCPPSGPRRSSSRQQREGLAQKEWAAYRGKTQQTVSDNVRTAYSTIHDLPDHDTFRTENPALEELDPDADETGDIRLV